MRRAWLLRLAGACVVAVVLVAADPSLVAQVRKIATSAFGPNGELSVSASAVTSTVPVNITGTLGITGANNEVAFFAGNANSYTTFGSASNTGAYVQWDAGNDAFHIRRHTGGSYVSVAGAGLLYNATALAATSTDGIVSRNTTAATVGTQVQLSPRIKMLGNGWDVDDAVSRAVSFFTEVLPVAGNTVSGSWRLAYIDPVSSAISYPLDVSASAVTSTVPITIGTVSGTARNLNVGGSGVVQALFEGTDTDATVLFLSNADGSTKTWGIGVAGSANAGGLVDGTFYLRDETLALNRLTLNATGMTVLGVTASGATSGIGYATGAGGTVTQLTSKSTGVTLNTVTGEITLNAAALAADTAVSFTLTSTAIAAGDMVLVQHVSAGTIGAYVAQAVAAAGSASITVRNVTAGSLSEAIVLKYVVIKAVTS